MAKDNLPVKKSNLAKESAPIVFQGDFCLIPREIGKYKKFSKALKHLLPLLGNDVSKIITTQVMLVLKLEGLIGKDLSNRELKMINVVKNAILASTEKREEALVVAQKFLGGH